MWLKNLKNVWKSKTKKVVSSGPLPNVTKVYVKNICTSCVNKYNFWYFHRILANVWDMKLKVLLITLTSYKKFKFCLILQINLWSKMLRFLQRNHKISICAWGKTQSSHDMVYSFSFCFNSLSASVTLI